MLLRRLDRVEVIGGALTASASGVGVRTISRRLDLPATTVRGWIRRFAARASGADDADQRRPHALIVPFPPASSAPASPGARWRQASRESQGQFLR
jgi:hypothetical protein